MVIDELAPRSIPVDSTILLKQDEKQTNQAIQLSSLPPMNYPTTEAVSRARKGAARFVLTWKSERGRNKK